MEKGFVLTGGGSLLGGLLEKIREQTKIPTFIAEYPFISLIEGCENILKKIKLFDKDL